MRSAYINTPPANDLDRRIVKGMYLTFGIVPNDTMIAEGMTIPPFRPSNYHFETKATGIIAGLSICLVIIVLVTLTRLYLRLSVRALKFGADDYVIIPGFILAATYPCLQIAIVKAGAGGYHMYDVTYLAYYRYNWLASISQTFFYVSVGLIKCSIACFNIRLTSIATTTWKYVNYAFLVLCSLYTLTALFLNVFRCSPAGISFDLLHVASYDKPPKCLSINAMNSILRLNLALDFSLLAIPVIVLWKVQMSWRKKGRLFALLSIGAIACIGSVMTLVSQYLLATDPLWNYTTLLAWIMVELTISIVAACAPTMAYLFPRVMRTQATPSAPGTHRGEYASKGAAYGLGSQNGKKEKDASMVRSRTMDEPGDEEDDEQRIIVTEDIEMKWHGSNSGSDGGHPVDGRSVTSWLEDGKPVVQTEIFDGSTPGARPVRTWAVRGGNSKARGPVVRIGEAL